MRLRRVLFHASLLLILLLLPLRSTLPAGTRWNTVALLARDHSYNWLAWLPSALGAKLGQALWGLRPFMDEAAASQFLRDYVAELRGLQALETQIEALYSDAAQSDPYTASAGLRSRRDVIRQHLRERQGLAESVLEGQLAALLVDLGFAVAGQVLPPVAMRLTSLPQVLVVSPRDEIRYEISIGLEPLPLDEAVALEGRIEERLDASALVLPIGGIALYPAMILESASIATLADTFAHEWLHHYLFAFPLGQAWDYDSEARVINETVASLFAQEAAPRLLRRYYPELARPAASRQRVALSDQGVFNFGAEMDRTRRRVDELLERGEVEAAEDWMEGQRQRFVANGYAIRRLNQAWFAFYGGYQSEAQGPGGDDPVGPALRELLARSHSLHDWVVSLRGITTTEQLLALLEQSRRQGA
ncbi:MAG: hypothetical protein OXH77_03630 [Anaerolineaceae bacterium]|nr:hypothetical protein [Anaerolineaceae bacterium]